MDEQTYTFDSTAEIRLARLLGIPRLRTPLISLAGPTRIHRSHSTSPSPGQFLARTTMQEMELTGTLLGVTVTVILNDAYDSEGTIEGQADPNSPDPAKPEPRGRLRSSFNVYVEVATPFGTFVNDQPVQMEATIKEIPPAYARYQQYSPPRDLIEKTMRYVAGEMQCAVHKVQIVLPDGLGRLRSGG